jgi:CDP-diacylglycerol--glycerol-3-phosphate 3-phosphatidyltransferase
MKIQSTESDPTTLTDRLRARAASTLDPVIIFLAKLKIPPDALTILGMLLHILFAWLIANEQMRLAAVAIFVFVPLDALDGALARKIGRPAKNFGAFLDSTSDRLAEIILFAGYLYYFYNQNESLMVAASYFALTGSLMVSYTRSRAEALGFSCKVGLFTRVERYVVIVLSLVFNLPGIGMIILAAGTYLTLVQRILHVWKQARDTK